MSTRPKLLIPLLLVFLIGCANTEGLETQIKMLRTEMQSQLETQSRMLRSDMQSQNQSLNKRIDDLKAVHEKDTKETQTSLIDLQRDFLANKRVVEDSARRVYLLEVLMTARRATPAEQREGYITFVKDKQIAISLGSENGVKTGETFDVYKGGSLKNQIASIRILSVEAESAMGEIINQTEDVSIGDRIDKKK